MVWLKSIVKGINHKVLKGQHHGKYEDYTSWEEPHTSVGQWVDSENEELNRALALSIAEEDVGGKKIADNNSQLEEDEQLARALQNSWNIGSPPRQPPPQSPRYNYGDFLPPYSFLYPSGNRTCAGCKSEISHGRYLSCLGAFWHPECFHCHACNLPIADYEFSMSDGLPYHKSCYKELHHPKCDVCKKFIPTTATSLIEYRAHSFWHQKYCPSHERDGTPRCCSCERMEPLDTRFLVLDDGRKLCLECLDSAIMDTHECQPLFLEIREFYEGLNMKVEQQIPLLLVERQALNEAMEGEKHGHHHLPETRGLCLSEERTISTISRRPTIGGYRIIDMFTEPYMLVRQCEVTAILILYGLPRLLTGSILAHEMMHAWLRLRVKLLELNTSNDAMHIGSQRKRPLCIIIGVRPRTSDPPYPNLVGNILDYPTLSPEVEEGICQVMAHMWLDSEVMAGSGSYAASSSSSSSSSSSGLSSGSSKKGKASQFEKKLGEFFKHQIESDTSHAYGDGFREGNKAVLKYGLKSTLDHIRLTGSFPC